MYVGITDVKSLPFSVVFIGHVLIRPSQTHIFDRNPIAILAAKVF
jgi:hypothetical protein